MDGDKQLGIEYLKKAAKLSLFLKEQANIYLFHIYLRYENDPASSLPYARLLAESFPDNLRFTSLYAEALFYNKDFDNLKPLAETLAAQQKKFYTIPGYLFKGIVAEHNNNLAEAKKYFNFSLSQADDNEGEDDHYVAMDYAGLARVAIRENKPDEARNYYKQAAKTEPYIPVKAEADAYLSNTDQ
jgi:tetratricopeptide (TPR) repeat protein